MRYQREPKTLRTLTLNDFTFSYFLLAVLISERPGPLNAINLDCFYIRDYVSMTVLVLNVNK